MEVISIERSTYEELLTSFNSFVTKIKEMASRVNDKGLGDWLDNQDVCQILNISPFGVTNKKPNSFTNPPQFAYPCIIAAPYQGALNPRFAFITGRIALIFQNRFTFTSFFRNFAGNNLRD